MWWKIQTFLDQIIETELRSPKGLEYIGRSGETVGRVADANARIFVGDVGVVDPERCPVQPSFGRCVAAGPLVE